MQRMKERERGKTADDLRERWGGVGEKEDGKRRFTKEKGVGMNMFLFENGD